MPNQNGILTDAENQQINTWLKENWSSWVCPFSHHTQWQLGAFLVHTPKFIPGSWVELGGPSMPSVVVICTGCGYQVFINAVKVGIVSAADDPTKEESDV